MLQFWHELTVKAAHGVTSQEPVALVLQVAVDPGQLCHQGVLTCIILLYQHQLELAVNIFNDSCYLFILNNIDLNLKKMQ